MLGCLGKEGSRQRELTVKGVEAGVGEGLGVFVGVTRTADDEGRCVVCMV